MPCENDLAFACTHCRGCVLHRIALQRGSCLWGQGCWAGAAGGSRAVWGSGGQRGHGAAGQWGSPPCPPPLPAGRGSSWPGGSTRGRPPGCLGQPTLRQNFGENEVKGSTSPVPLESPRGGGGCGTASAAGSSQRSAGDEGEAAMLGPLIKSPFPRCHLKRVVVRWSRY